MTENTNINSFQDLIIEEFDIEESVLEDDFEESMDMLDVVMSKNDEKRVEFIESSIDSFINDIDLNINRIVREEREESMNELMEFFDEDAELFEEALDMEIENLEELESSDIDGSSSDEDGDMIDAVEGLPDIEDEMED